ncbi:MAG: permease, partial [Planctomycetota bacterium]|nr:permease [Planctomycetota bacterium]
MIDFINAIWSILVESGPWLLGGFFIAGLLKEFVPQEKVFRHLGQDDFWSVLKASLVGAPLPLCSCSVIPTAAGLKQAGASRGATTSFLIATPETGVDSVGITYALMDPIMTILRPVSAVLTAVVSGCLVNNLNLPPDETTAAKSCCSKDKTSPRPSLLAAIKFGYGKLMSDLAPWFVLGFMLSALITLFVPNNFFGNVIPTGWLSLIAMLAMSMPMYICATASTPIAVAL